MHTLEKIKNDLVNLGIKSGDTLFLRISYRAIGKIDGGPKSFIDALLDVIGKDGTIILTAFPKKYIRQMRFMHRRQILSSDTRLKTLTGVMSEFAIAHPDAKISRKLEFPFVAIGKNAEYLTANHTHDKNAYWIIEEAIEKFNCKCLRIGGEPLFGTTHLSLEKALRDKGENQTNLRYGIYVKENGQTKWYDTPNVLFCKNAFIRNNKRIHEISTIAEGTVGDGYAIITDMRKAYDEEVKIFSEDIHNATCDDPNCIICRTSYSFSDSSYPKFLFRQTTRIFSSDFKQAVKTILKTIERITFGIKVI